MVCLRILWHYGIPWYQNVVPCYSCETPCLLSQDTRKRRWRAKSGGRRALTKCIGSGMHTKARESMPAVCCAHGNVWNQLINISITSESFEQTNMTATAFDKASRVLWGHHKMRYTRTNPAKSARKWLIYVVFGRKLAVFFRSTLFNNHANIVIWGWWFCQRGSALDRIFWTMLRLGSAEGMDCWCSRGSTCCQRLGLLLLSWVTIIECFMNVWAYLNPATAQK